MSRLVLSAALLVATSTTAKADCAQIEAVHPGETYTVYTEDNQGGLISSEKTTEIFGYSPLGLFGYEFIPVIEGGTAKRIDRVEQLIKQTDCDINSPQAEKIAAIFEEFPLELVFTNTGSAIELTIFETGSVATINTLYVVGENNKNNLTEVLTKVADRLDSGDGFLGTYTMAAGARDAGGVTYQGINNTGEPVLDGQ